MSSALGLLAFVLTARALGPTEFGILALIFTFVRTIENLVAFQSWQPLITYGVNLFDPNRHNDLRTLLKFGLLLDAAAALLSWAIALTVISISSSLLAWSEQVTAVALAFSTVLLFRIVGVPLAVLRMANRFRTLAYSETLLSLARLISCAVAFQAGGGLWSFAIVWMVLQIANPLLLLWLAFRELRSQAIHRVLSAPVRGVTRRFPGIMSFVWSTNIALTLQTSTRQVDTLIVGALLDPASAGFYHIAKRVGRLAQQVGAQTQAVLYPDLARYWAEGRIQELRTAVLQVEAILSTFGIALFLLILPMARPLLVRTAGPEFEAAAPLLVVQMLAVTLLLAGAASKTALLAMGKQNNVLRIVIFGTLAFHPIALLSIPRIGAMGAVLAHIVFGVIWVSGLGYYFIRAFRKAQT